MSNILNHGFVLDPCAYALRLVRVDEKRNEFLNYEAVTFPKGPWDGVELYLRRACIKPKAATDSAYVVDILDAEGDIVQDFIVSQQQANYFKTKLKLRRERDADPPPPTQTGAR